MLLAFIGMQRGRKASTLSSVLTDYYILENNALLKAALKYKRIQLTDFRTVSMEHFGENKGFCLTASISNEGLLGSVKSGLGVGLDRLPGGSRKRTPAVNYCYINKVELNSVLLLLLLLL